MVKPWNLVFTTDLYLATWDGQYSRKKEGSTICHPNQSLFMSMHEEKSILHINPEMDNSDESPWSLGRRFVSYLQLFSMSSDIDAHLKQSIVCTPVWTAKKVWWSPLPSYPGTCVHIHTPNALAISDGNNRVSSVVALGYWPNTNTIQSNDNKKRSAW